MTRPRASMAIAAAASAAVLASCGRPGIERSTMAWTSSGILLFQEPGGTVDTLGPGFYPALDPRCCSLAFVRDDPATGGSSLVTINLRTGVETVVLTCGGSLMDLCWSPDGTAIAFVSGSPDGSRALEICTPDGALRDTLAAGSGAQGIVYLRPSWLPDSRGLLYNDMTCLYRIRLDGAVQEWIPLGEITHNSSALSFSDRFTICPSDSTLVAYTRLIPSTPALSISTSAASTHALFVYDTDDGSSLQMTTADMCALDPVWTMDGATIYFWGYDSRMSSRGEQYVFALDRGSGLVEALVPGQSPSVR